MKNRYLSNEEKRACEGLWSEAFFEDSDSFREYYFTEKVKTNQILVAEKDGQNFVYDSSKSLSVEY